MSQLSNEKLLIDRAKETDMPRIAQIVRSSAEWYRPFVAQKDMSEHLVDEKWQNENYRKREFWIGKNQAGKGIGTLSLQYFNKSAYLGYVYLDANHTGKGHGRRLLDHARLRAQDQGMKQMVLIAHPKANWAIKAYERYGFKRLTSEKEQVLAWNQGALRDYYEEGFHLYCYDL